MAHNASQLRFGSFTHCDHYGELSGMQVSSGCFIFSVKQVLRVQVLYRKVGDSCLSTKSRPLKCKAEVLTTKLTLLPGTVTRQIKGTHAKS